jgi:pyruvate formate lyase activating enzyme
MEALFYNKLENGEVQCQLCPHNCIIKEDNYGVCKVRTNDHGILVAQNYGHVSSIGFDPIEKKPLYHFYPGSEILSVGSIGCNLKCKFCQNWEISQSSVDDLSRDSKMYSSEMIVELAKSREENVGIAFTYNEPTVFYEFMLDTAKLAKKNGLNNVMISNGYINSKPLEELMPYIDAFNIDLKSFSEYFFTEYTKSQLEPVKETLKAIVEAQKHLEITNLVIPSLNDDPEEYSKMINWLYANLGENIVLHISRYFPTYKLSIEATSIEKMIKLGQIAKEKLKYVYLGNMLLEEGNNTYCSNCKELVVKRSGYSSKSVSINSEGNCMNCGNHILNFIKK